MGSGHLERDKLRKVRESAPEGYMMIKKHQSHSPGYQ